MKDRQLPVVLHERDNIKFFKTLFEQNNVTAIVVKSDMVKAMRKDVAMVQNFRSALNLVNWALSYDVTHNRKRFNILKETFAAHPSGFAFLKRTMLQEMFEQHIHTVFEGGFFLYWALQHQTKSQMSLNFGDDDSDIVKFGDLAPFWVVVGVGWTITKFVKVSEKM
uniref:Uncharacterized protein n=1 Tax=Anopheles culicifacies TaxID=139723 RepID=A0A182MG29_9DIPT